MKVSLLPKKLRAIDENSHQGEMRANLLYGELRTVSEKSHKKNDGKSTTKRIEAWRLLIKLLLKM